MALITRIQPCLYASRVSHWQLGVIRTFRRLLGGEWRSRVLLLTVRPHLRFGDQMFFNQRKGLHETDKLQHNMLWFQCFVVQKTRAHVTNFVQSRSRRNAVPGPLLVLLANASCHGAAHVREYRAWPGWEQNNNAQPTSCPS
jgi:hypothetical protein